MTNILIRTSCVLMTALFIIGMGCLLVAVAKRPAHAAPNTYELEMRRLKALEAIASAMCFGKPTTQCMNFRQQGDVNADRLHSTP